MFNLWLIVAAAVTILSGCASVRSGLPTPDTASKVALTGSPGVASPTPRPPVKDQGVWPSIPAGSAQSPPQVPMSAGLTLETARNLALQHNLEIQGEAWEETAWSSSRQANLARVLPHFVTSGEWTDHGKGLLAYAGSASDGSPGVVEGFSGRGGRRSFSYFGEMRWSPHDAFSALLSAGTMRNERDKARLMRIRAAQKAVGGAEAAFYRLLSFQECLPSVRKLVALRVEIARQTGDLKRSRLADVEEASRAEQKEASARLLETRISTELERQRTMLAVYLGVSPQAPPGRNLCVAGPLPVPKPMSAQGYTERIPPVPRPDLCAEGLNFQNAEVEVTRHTIKAVPKVTGYMRLSNERRGRRSETARKEDAGVLMYFDATEWFASLMDRKAAVSRREKSAARFRAISLAVEAETRLAYMRCMEGYKDLHTLELAVARARELAHAARAKAKVGEIEPVAADEAQANFLQDEVERLRMLGEVNARCAELSAALGTNYRSSAACE